MRTTLSPLLLEIEAYVRAARPSAEITRHVLDDMLSVRIGGGRFGIAPLKTRHRADATWPIYVTPIPATEFRAWECHTLEEVAQTLGWPGSIPRVRIVTDEMQGKGKGKRRD
jgi:hypothetical protein